MSISIITEIDVVLANPSLARRREAATLATHYAAGLLDCDSVTDGILSVREGLISDQETGSAQ
jgi:hypothetical protein